MNAFDKVIGYDPIKNELRQICDMLRNKEKYEKMGAKLPHGILLYGNPGLGKTLMADSFIEESGLESFVIRRNKDDGDFISGITDSFAKAKEQAPSIVFLDDMDKFANEDDKHCDAEEYVAVQSGIDEVKGSGVLVLATANNIRKLPDSLIRFGRFDRRIEIECPKDTDAEKIIAHYLRGKKVSADVNMEDVCKMISYSSCADLEVIMNEAAINAAYDGKEEIGMGDIVKTVLKMQYASAEDLFSAPDKNKIAVAIHEAGHLVVSEVLQPGSIGFATLRVRNGDVGGVVHHCMDPANRRTQILVSLAGKAAVEMHGSEVCASGCQSDIRKAYCSIRDGVTESGTAGLGMIDVSYHQFDVSESFNARNEAVVQAELERNMFKARDILYKNREFLEKTAAALVEKGTLLYSDIRAIRESTEITYCAA